MFNTSTRYSLLPLFRGYVWGALLHQMLHAYFALLTGVVETTQRTSCRSPLWQGAAQRLVDYLDFVGLDLEHVIRPLGAEYKPVNEIALLQDAHLGEQHPAWRPMPAPTGLSAAHRELLKTLNRPLTPAQVQPRYRIWRAFSTCGPTTSQHTLLEAFNDIDVLLFGGILRHRVHVQWTPQLGHETWLGTCSPPHSAGNDSPRIMIELVQDHTWYESRTNRRAYEWGTLIHEMLHAYLWVTTGGADDKVCTCKARVVHGPRWTAAIRALARKLDIGEIHAKHLGDADVDCHRWGSWAEFVRNRDAKRVGADDYEKYN
ncbi:hypothetical protein LTR85_003281 [Meristemomyces frigidus]|nr:hypothetical protein LTR85_003281 [Meristemomyces frigidus]